MLLGEHSLWYILCNIEFSTHLRCRIDPLAHCYQLACRWCAFWRMIWRKICLWFPYRFCTLLPPYCKQHFLLQWHWLHLRFHCKWNTHDVQFQTFRHTLVDGLDRASCNLREETKWVSVSVRKHLPIGQLKTKIFTNYYPMRCFVRNTRLWSSEVKLNLMFSRFKVKTPNLKFLKSIYFD